MRVLVTGGTGFIGRHLVDSLIGRGDRVSLFTRAAGRSGRADVETVEWTPTERGDWYSRVSGQNVVVHLAGEQAVGGRLTETRRREIERSRIESTRRLVEAIQEADRRPDLFLCASAVGFYGPRDEAEVLDESSEPGEGFLAELTVAWEAAALAAAEAGVRVVLARFGIVLGKDGGALPEMARPFRLFVGGPIGGGDQIVPWVHIDDVTRALLHVIDQREISGPVNVVAPNPVSNRELSRAIGDALGRPSWVPVPALALRAMFGREGALPIVTGQRALPRVLERTGFEFRHPEVEEALRHALG